MIYTNPNRTPSNYHAVSSTTTIKKRKRDDDEEEDTCTKNWLLTYVHVQASEGVEEFSGVVKSVGSKNRLLVKEMASNGSGPSKPKEGWFCFSQCEIYADAEGHSVNHDAYLR